MSFLTKRECLWDESELVRGAVPGRSAGRAGKPSWNPRL